MASTTLTKLLTKTVNVEAVREIAGGGGNEPVTVITGLKTTPFYPMSPELRQRYELKANRNAWVTYCSAEQNVKQGFILVEDPDGDAKPYKVLAANPWPADAGGLEIHMSAE